MPRLYPLFSGSSGNCYYLGSSERGILIDAGRSARQIVTALSENSLDIKNVMGIFITHEHSDHISGLRVLASRNRIPVFASPGTIKALSEKNIIDEKVDISPVTPEGMEIGDMFAVPFHTSHDCAEGFGYTVLTSDGRKTAFATDTGYVTGEMDTALEGSDTVVIESNHDVGMLQNGFYPYVLKERILSEKGHLSNDACADKIMQLVRQGSTRFLLAHLSRENNIPVLAENTSVCVLSQNGMKRNEDYILKVAPEKGGEALIY